MSTFPAVIALSDGSEASADTLNRPLLALKERTDYLYTRLNELYSTGIFSSLRYSSFYLDTDNPPAVNSVVYLDPVSNVVKAALSTTVINPVTNKMEAGPSAVILGLLIAAAGNVGTVVMGGVIDGTSVALSSLLESNETFVPGTYYLSSRTPGKLTKVSTGIRSCFGTITYNTSVPSYAYQLVINPQQADVDSMHSHRGVVLHDVAAGANTTFMDGAVQKHRIRGFVPSYMVVPVVYVVKEVLSASTIALDTTEGDVTTLLVPGSWMLLAGSAVAGNNDYFAVVSSLYDIGTNQTIVTLDTAAMTADVTLGITSTLTDPAFRLFVGGVWRGQGTVTYTFRLENGGTDFSDATLYWSTDDGSDDVDGVTGVRLTSFEQPISIGQKGLMLALEPGYNSSVTAPDFSTPTNLNLLVADLAATTRTWSVTIPTAADGWLPVWTRELSTYIGSSAVAPTYQLRVFGKYVSPDGRTSEELTFVVSSAGDLALGTVDIEVYDRLNTLIATLSGVSFSGPAYHIVDGTDFDLWLIVDSYDTAGIPAAVTTAAVTDSWRCTFQDFALGADFLYNNGFNVELQTYYPPTPLDSVILSANGVLQSPRDLYRTGYGSYKALPHGIYWFGNDSISLPFNRTFVSVSSLGDEWFALNVQLFVSESRFANSGIVTSLTPSSDGSVELFDAVTGLPSTTGNLLIRARLSTTTAEGNKAGFQVFKGINAKNEMEKGPVVEAITSGPGISITPENPAYPGQGRLRVELSGSGVSTGDFSKITMLNAKQERVPNRLFTFTKLLPWDSTKNNNVPSAFIAEFRVPYNFSGNYRVAFYASIFGIDAVGASDNPVSKKYAGLELTYSVLQDLTLPGSNGQFFYISRNLLTVDPTTGIVETTIKALNDIPFGRQGVGYTAYDTFLCHNDPSIPEIDGQVIGPIIPLFPQLTDSNDGVDFGPVVVTAGNLVSLRFNRVAPSAARSTVAFEYKGAIGFSALTWRLVPVIA